MKDNAPPHPEPDCQPPSDGGLLPCPKPFAWYQLHPYHGEQFAYEALKPDDFTNGWVEKPLYTRANPPTPEPDELEPIEKIVPTEIEISGPYHYDGEKHPCLRLDAPERIVGVVYIVGDDKERAFAEAQTIKEAFRLGGKEIDRIHYASANPSTEPVASGRYEFPYQRTFESIARSVTVHPNGHVGISVKAFQERFNKDGVVLATPTPEGDYVLVPKVPTEEMLSSVYGLCGHSLGSDNGARYVYQTMIAAAPNPLMGGETKLKPKEN